MRLWSVLSLASLLWLSVSSDAGAAGYEVPVAAAFTADSTAVLVGWSNGAVTRTVVTQATASRLGDLADGGPVKALTVSADGRRVAVASSGSVEVWDLATGKLRIREKLPRAPGSIWLSSDASRLLVRAFDSSLLFDADSGRKVGELRGGDDDAPGFVSDRAITFSDHHLLAWSRDGTATADVEVGVLLAAAAVSPDRLLVSTSDGMKVVDLRTGNILAAGDRRQGPSQLIVLGPDRIVGADPDAWRLYDRAGRARETTRSLPGGSLREAHRVDSSRIVRWRADGAIELIGVAPESRREIVQLSDAARLLAASPDGRWALALLAGGVTHLYDLADGEMKACLNLENDAHRCAVAGAISEFRSTPGADTATDLIAAVQAAPPAQLEPKFWNLVADSHHYLSAARLRLDRDDLAGAQAAYEWLLASPDKALTQEARFGLVATLLAGNRSAAAIGVLQPLIADLRQDPEARNAGCRLCQALDMLGQAHLANGNLSSAHTAAAEAAANLGRYPDPAVAGRVRADYAGVLERQGRWIEGETVRARLLQTDDEDAQPSDVAAAGLKLSIAEALASRDQGLRADALASEAVHALAGQLDASHPLVIDGRERLGLIRLRALDEPARALEPLRAAASALAEASARTSRGRFDRFRSVFRAQVAAAWVASATPPSRETAPRAPEIRHRAPVGSLAASKDGALLASGDEDGRTIVWRLADRAAAAQFAVDRPVRALEFTDDGRRVAIAGDGLAKLEVRRVDGGVAQDASLRLARPMMSYGRLSVAFDRLGRRARNAETAWRTAVSADGSAVAYATDDGQICLWRLTDDAPRCAKLGASAIGAIAFDPDGRSLLAATGYEPVLRLDLSSLEANRRSPLKDAEQAKSAAISPDGRFAAIGTRAGQVRVLDWSSGRELFELEGHIGEVKALTFLPDGRLVSAGRDGKLVIWDMQEAMAIAALGASSYGAGHAAAVVSVDASPDGSQVVTTSADRTLRTWDATSGLQIRMQRLNSEFAMARYLDASHIAVLGRDISILDLASGRARQLGAGGESRKVAAWSAPSHAALFDDHTGRVDVVRVDGEHSATAVQGPRGFAAAALTPDGAGLAILDKDGAVTLWNGATGEQTRPLIAKGGRDVAMVGSTLFVHADQGLLRFDARTGAALPEGDGKACGGRRLQGRGYSGGATGGGGRFLIWGIGDICSFDAEGRSRASLGSSLFRTAVSTVTISSDANMIGVGLLDGGVVVADANAGAVRWRLEGHSGTITSLAFTTDGARLISGSADRTAKVWDLRTGELVSTLGE
jgi:WD40 repeat protein